MACGPSVLVTRKREVIYKLAESFALFRPLLIGSEPCWVKTNSFLIGHKELLFFWTSDSMFIFLWPLNTLASSLGIGWSKGPQGRGSAAFHLALALGCGRGKKWPSVTDWIWYTLCDTWRDKRDLPALNWNLSFLPLSSPCPVSSLPPSLHCDDLVGMSVTWTNASSDYNLLIVVYNENCKLF